MTRVRCGGSGRDTTGKPAKRCANGNAVIVNLGSDCFCTKICLCRRAPQRAIFQRPYFTLLCNDPTITCWPSMFGWAFVLLMFIGRGLRHSRPARITRPLRAGIFSVLSWPAGMAASVPVWKLPPSLPNHYAAVIEFDLRVIAGVIPLQPLTFVGKREHCRQCRSRMLPPSTHAKEKT